MWPFAKLLNGFSSHRYVYNPILLDSQEQITFYLPHAVPTAGDASRVTTILPTLRWSPMQNGNADGYHLSFLVPLQVQHLKMTMVTGLSPMGNGNAYDQLSFLDPAAGAGT